MTVLRLAMHQGTAKTPTVSDLAPPGLVRLAYEQVLRGIRRHTADLIVVAGTFASMILIGVCAAWYLSTTL